MKPLTTLLALAVLVLLGLATLYAYGQRPPTESVAITAVVQEIRDGSVKRITLPVNGSTADVEPVDGTRQQVTVAGQTADRLAKEASDYNAANPRRPQVVVEFRQESQPLQWIAQLAVGIAQLVIAIAPIIFIAGLLLFLLRRADIWALGERGPGTGG